MVSRKRLFVLSAGVVALVVYVLYFTDVFNISPVASLRSQKLHVIHSLFIKEQDNKTGSLRDENRPRLEQNATRRQRETLEKPQHPIQLMRTDSDKKTGSNSKKTEKTSKDSNTKDNVTSGKGNAVNEIAVNKGEKQQTKKAVTSSVSERQKERGKDEREDVERRGKQSQRRGEESQSCVNVSALLMRDQFSDVKIKGKFKRNVKVMLTKKNDVMSDVVAGWWTRLQPFRNNKPFSQIVKELFQVIPGEDPFPAIHSQCRRCAVVGGSVNLIGTGYGSLIDSKDIVIRMNTAPVRGYEKDIGSKTTHHIVYPESAKNYRGAQSSGKLVLMPFKLLDIQWLISIFTTHNISRGWTSVPTRLALTGKDAMVVHPEFIYYVRHTWYESRGRWASAGGFAIIWALHICDEVDVFGFGRNQYGNWAHYYDKFVSTGTDPFRRTGVHDADREEVVRLALTKAAVIQFHAGK